MKISDIATYTVGNGMYAARHDGKLLMVAVTDTGMHSWWERSPQKLWTPDVVRPPEQIELCIAESFGCEAEESIGE